MNFNKEIQEQIDEIKNIFSSYSQRVYLVGGCVRDLFLGYKIKDLDFEVFDVSEVDFKFLMNKIAAKGVGESFFVYKYKNIDISLPRVEKKVAYGHRGFVVKLCNDIKEASKRRDFTINSLMWNIYDNSLEDFWGGVRDIKEKTIRIIDENMFKEDSLRVLRAMQFSARFKFKIDKESIKIIQNISLADLAKERVFLEFEKLFYSKYLHFGLYYLFKLKIAQKIFKIDIDFKTFLKTSKELQKNQKNFDKRFYPLYFLYILSKNININFNFISHTLNAPNFYKKNLSKQLIKNNPSIKELHLISLNYPIKEWLGNYQANIAKIAKKYNIYEKKFNPIKVIDVINDGFKDKEISIELKKRELKKIDEMFDTF